MPQVIYTGQNYAQYQPSQGRALQALSQFAQQQQIRDENQLQRAREDRNLMARAMELNPVYATSGELQGRIGEIMDEYIDASTLLTKDMEGREMLTTDLVKAQQMKSQAMAEMMQIKSWDEELNRSWKMVNERSDDFDMPFFLENYEKLRKNKRMPEGGLLYKKVKDPEVEFINWADQYKGTPKRVNDEWVDTPDGGGYYKYHYIWPEGKSESWLIEKFISLEDGQYHIQNTFDRLGKAERDMYSGAPNEDVAANARFRKSVAGKTYSQAQYQDVRKPPVSEGAPGYGEKAQEKTYLSEDGIIQYVDGKQAFSRDYVSGSMIAKDGQDGMQFPSDIKPMSIPVANLEFSDKKLKLGKATRIWVRPTIAAKDSGKDKIEFAIDAKEGGMITVEVDDPVKMPLDIAKNKKFEMGTDENGKDIYRYKIPIPENITATGEVSGVGAFVNSATEGWFTKRYNEWFGGQGNDSPDNVAEFMKANNLTDRDEAIKILKKAGYNVD